MIKIVLMFLMLMVVISMIGNLVTKFMGTPKPPIAKNQTKAICGSCGRTVLGTARCICGKG